MYPSSSQIKQALRPPLTQSPLEPVLLLSTLNAGGYRYSHNAYLVQLRRTGSGSHLIDPIGFDDLQPLANVIADEEWILHAASQDLPCLAELKMVPNRLFDTEMAARILGRPKVGLAALAETELWRVIGKGTFSGGLVDSPTTGGLASPRGT